MNGSPRQRSAFTLIELLIVVAIIGILAAISVPNFLNARMRAKIAATQSDLRTFVNAMQQYRMDNNSYHLHSGGPLQQRPLTTPVAYLNGFLFDRFQRKKADSIGPPGFDDHTLGLYHWMPAPGIDNADHWRLWGPPFTNTDAELSQCWKQGGLVDGWGPAGIRGGPPYNATNGLVSRGGFFKTVPKG